MAKPIPNFTVQEIEEQLGYTVVGLYYPGDDAPYFYSDLTPVSQCAIDRAQRELDEHVRQSLGKYEIILPESSPGVIVRQEGRPDLRLPHSWTTTCHRCTMTFTCGSRVGHYNFAVNVRWEFDLELSLLLTLHEVVTMNTTAMLRLDLACGLGPVFSRLSAETRLQIYNLAMPRGQWRTVLVDCPKSQFPGTIGDPSGFYFPLSHLGVLTANKQMRREALPLAYRSTRFQVDHLDDLVQLLIGIGDIGRANIGSLEFDWQSRADVESQQTEAPTPAESSPTLPITHVTSCIQLLGQCHNLKSVRLHFDPDLISRIPPKIYQADPGLSGLRSIRIERLEVYDLGDEPLAQREFVGWLQERLPPRPKTKVA
ncbi:uncharacterized protein PV07_12619 [Cladophialophora immunda]|uniref:Uncharacterized protein n=1 Tax=Cladophialophora immunda TaxID=569365 RepID=A0A0D2BU94_9EURO|nr:uncharacterized protein PV07_12619 [Cladophialophora immunda]KIW21980.1 hypothetical protein PV07_12619 [Cladophialophora immunda]